MAGGNSQTSSTTPWSGVQPYMRDVLGQAQGFFQRGTGQEFFPGDVVADLTPQQLQAFDMIGQRAVGGSPQEAGFGNYLTSTFGMPNVNPMDIASLQFGAAGGITPGMQMLGQGGYNPYTSIGADMLQGFGGAPGFADYGSQVSGMLGGGPGLNDFGSQISGMLGASPGFADYGAQVSNMLGGVGQDQLQATARGDFLNGNPYLDSLYDNAARRVTDTFNEATMPAINSTFGAAGRSGSGIMGGVTAQAMDDLGENLSGLAADIYAPAYEAERARQLQASGQLANQGLGAASLAGNLFQGGQQLDMNAANLAGRLFDSSQQRGLGAAGLAGSLFEGGQQRGLSAAQGLGQLGLGAGGLGLEAGRSMADLGLAGTGQLGGLFNDIGMQQFRAGSLVPSFSGLEYGNLDMLNNVGQQLQNQQQNEIAGDMQRFNFEQMAPWEALNRYSNVVYGLPGGFGSTTQRQNNGLGSVLSGAGGGAMTGFSLGGPWGAAIGGGLGGLLGFFG